MKLLSLHIHAFASLKDLTVPFREDVNLFYGENEAGKTSIAECLCFLFYGFADAKEFERFCPWDGDSVHAELTVRQDGKEYLLERSAYRNGGDQYTIRSLPDKALCFVDRAPWEAFLGVAAPLYRRSAFFVAQKNGLAIDAAPMEAGIERLLLAADHTVDIPHANGILKQASLALEDSQDNSGILPSLAENAEILSQNLQATQNAQTSLFRAEHKRNKLQRELTALEADLKKQEALLQFFEEGTRRNAFIRLNTKRSQAKEAAEDLERLEQLHTHQGFFPDRAYISRLQSFQQPLQELSTKRTELQNQCQNLQKHLAIADVDAEGLAVTQLHLQKKRRFHTVLSVLSGIATLTCGITAALTVQKLSLFSLFFALAFLCSLSCLFFLGRTKKAHHGLHTLYRVWKAGNAGEFRQYLSTVRQEIQAQQMRRNEYNQSYLEYQRINASYENLHGEMQRELDRWGKQDLSLAIEQAEEALARYVDLSHKAELAASELLGYQVLLPVSEEEMQRFQTTPYDYPTFYNCNGDTIRSELASLTRARTQKQQQLQESDRTLAVLRATVTPPADKKELILFCRERLSNGKDKKDALELAYAALTKAGDTIREGLTPKLTAMAGEWMQRLTKDRHTGMRISKDLRPRLSEAPAGLSAQERFFSAGTADAAYLCLRLALAKTLFHPPLPLIFDETFVRLDDDRFAGALLLLQELAQQNLQILYFTHRKREAITASDVLGVPYSDLSKYKEKT